jgi:dihydrolipoamide dehydrogenase
LSGASILDTNYEVIVIGGGPAGYVAAIRCAQLGMKTACVDEWLDPGGVPALGGTCLNVGCIPSKALLESSEFYARLCDAAASHGIVAGETALDVPAMMARKDSVVHDLTEGVATLFRSNGIDWIQGHGQLQPERKVHVSLHTGDERTLSARHIILATGSMPVAIGAAPLHAERIVDSSGALEWTSVPRRLGIIGAGVIGLELGSVWRRLGSEVTLLEAQNVFLAMADQQIARGALGLFRKQGLNIQLGALVKSTQLGEDGVAIEYQDPDGMHTLHVDRLVVAVGRMPYTAGIASAEAGLLLDEGGYVNVDDECATNLPGVYAIGDVVRGPMLAHKGSEEGIAVAERIAGQSPEVHYDRIASVIYTQPEIAWVGKTEDTLKQSGVDYRVGVFPFLASGRARAMHETEGMVKVLSDAATDRVLGVHIMGSHASELIGQAVLAMEFDASSEDIARTVFAHPTLSEALHEAALAVDRRALHLLKPRPPK